MPPIDTPATDDLSQRGIPFRAHVHSQPIHSLEEAAAARGLDPDQIVRSLLFRLQGAEYVLVLMPGPEQVDWSKLRHHLGVSRVTTARPAEVERVTGYPPGAVSPFGLREPLRTLADSRILDYEEVSIGAGIKNAGLILSSQALVEAVQPELGDFQPD